MPSNLDVTLATLLFIANKANIAICDPEISGAINAIATATADDPALADALVKAVGARTGDGSFATVVQALGALVGESRLRRIGEGEDRAARVVSIRRALFGRSLPWLAVIIDRDADGTVGPHWVMVEGFTDSVLLMDPNPWNDVDEQRTLPLTDFLVMWELAGCQAVLIVE